MRPAISVSSSFGREVDEALDEVEAHAAHAGRVHRLQLVVCDAAAHGRDSARLAVRMRQRIHHRAVVGAVAGGLHDDIAREAEVVAQREQLLLAGVARRVLALRREGELRAGAEHVAVRVDGTGRQLEAGLARVGVPVEPTGGLGEFHFDLDQSM